MELFKGPHKIKHILEDNRNWERFVQRYPGLIRPAVLENVKKLFNCRTEALGFHTYACPECGYIVHVLHSCKSRFGTSCGKVATDNWME